LRLIYNPHDSVSLSRVINTPTRGIGAKTFARLERWAFEQRMSIFDALLKLRKVTDASASPFGARADRALVHFVDLMTALVTVREKMTLPELFDLTLARSGYRDFVRDGTREGEERWENLLELRGVTQEYAGVDPSEALPLFLEEVALVSDVDSLANDERGPALLTLHAAKGLEFPVVFIVGLDEGLLPHSRSIDDLDAMEEERRLCYVGMTRAMDRLYLLHTFRRTLFGNNELSIPSRFLTDLPSELVAGKAPRRQEEPAHQESVTSWSTPSARLTSAGRYKPEPSASTVPTPHFRVGDTVVHAKFGEGVIIESHMSDGDQEVEVAFPGKGIKRLSVSFAPLEKKD
jgi:DNA helicase-2/ATP-dependent DNA helicase PcrA